MGRTLICCGQNVVWAVCPLVIDERGQKTTRGGRTSLEQQQPIGKNQPSIHKTLPRKGTLFAQWAIIAARWLRVTLDAMLTPTCKSLYDGTQFDSR